MSELSSELKRVLPQIIELVNIPLYGARGVLDGGKLLVSALLEGEASVYVYDGKGLTKLSREPVSMVAEPPYGAGRVVIGRDVAKGRELHALYMINVSRPLEEEPLSKDLQPMRVLSIVDKGSEVFVTGVAPDGIKVFAAKPGGGAREVATVPGLGLLTDVGKGHGVGMLFTPSGRTSLLTLDLSTGEVGVKDMGGSVLNARFAPDGHAVIAVEGPDSVKLVKASPPDWSPEPLELPGRELSEYGPTGVNYMGYTPQGELIVVARKHGRSEVFVDGSRIEAPKGIHSATYRLGPDFVITHTSLSTPSRIIRVRSGEGWETILAADLPGGVKEAIGDSGMEWVRAPDGERVPTFYLGSRRAPRPGPTAVLVHGGPFSEYLDAWNVFAAALAISGFHVVMPNYRGSTGYGEGWRLKIIGDPCGAEMEDIIAAAEWARASGMADRTYIMGYSYGGYATMCALTKHPGKFAAGVAGASVVDWEEMYELSDPAFRAFIELLLGKDRGKWRERSPINYIDNMRDPLCIVHPQNDSRTPLQPILRFMREALEKGKSFEAHIAPDMGHAVNTAEDIVKILLPAVTFLLRQRLGPR